MKHSVSVLVLALQVSLTACDAASSSGIKSDESGPEGDLRPGLTIDRPRFLTQLGQGIAQRAQAFRITTEALHAASRVYCSTYAETDQHQLQLRYADSILAWERLEPLQIGPLAANQKALKTSIYGWPMLANYCKIDSEALLALDDVAYTLPPNTNRKGLQALEYLIFERSLATSCSSIQPTATQWQALEPARRKEARCAYMQAVAGELVDHAKILESVWGGVEDNAMSGVIGDPVGEQAALQDLFSSLFYFDVEVKNFKLAAPAGQDLLYCNKTPSPCPDKEELASSKLSGEALKANFHTLADIVFGFGEPRSGGLSALVRQQGGAAIADRSEHDIATLVQAVDQQPGGMDQWIAAKGSENCETTQASWLCQLRQSLTLIIADWKGEYASVLKTNVPVPAQGDND